MYELEFKTSELMAYISGYNAILAERGLKLSEGAISAMRTYDLTNASFPQVMRQLSGNAGSS